MCLAKLTHQTHGAQRTRPKQQVNSKRSNRTELDCLGRICVKPGINKHLEIEIIQQGATSLKHLGKSLWINLDTEINHHQVETKGPRTPLEVPSSRYRTRSFGRRENTLNLDIQIGKKCLHSGLGRVFKLPPLLTIRLPSKHKQKEKLKQFYTRKEKT